MYSCLKTTGWNFACLWDRFCYSWHRHWLIIHQNVPLSRIQHHTHCFIDMHLKWQSDKLQPAYQETPENFSCLLLLSPNSNNSWANVLASIFCTSWKRLELRAQPRHGIHQQATFFVEGSFGHGLQHPYLQCLGQLSPLPSVGRRNEYQPLGWVTIVMVMV